ncbi:MAG TPA: hypothetical protein PK589_18530 [Nitrospira sp.]|jgi:hypothetical protein|nr:hypothetical protein [Nitrospira sp.]HNG55596.1 hypothetical protein [Nitrospira sp.]HNJ21664.1 hypothetical protein [Nitrospira sp.]HNO34557.1 hypothetical protein [Nitrospira sp.]
MIITNFLDSDRQELNGEAVELIRTVTEPEPEFDEEVLPMMYVKVLRTGEVVLCFPEELK